MWHVASTDFPPKVEDDGSANTTSNGGKDSLVKAEQKCASSLSGLNKVRGRPWTSASLNLDSVSHYATIPRRRTSRQVPGYNQSYYESFFCDESSSVSSLPPSSKPSITYIVGGREVKSSSISHFYSLPPSSLPSIAEDDPFSFLSEYEQDRFDVAESPGCSCESVELCYFLPSVKTDLALEKWKAMEASGKFNNDASSLESYCSKPLFMTRNGVKGYSANDVSMWL